MKLLNFGSLNIDYVYDMPHFVQGGETATATARHVYAGGKGLNQSIAAAARVRRCCTRGRLARMGPS